MKKLKIRMEFIEDVLGTLPSNENLMRDYIASKSPEAGTIEDEVEAIGVDGAAEKRMTVFPRTASGEPFAYDYQIRGWLKDSISMLSKAGKAGYDGGKACAGLKAYKKAVDGLIFVDKRENVYDMHGMKLDACERPLRASTPQGERVSIACSEAIPAGSTLEFELILLDDKLEAVVLECLEYGRFRGFGQWRNSGKGTFTYTVM